MSMWHEIGELLINTIQHLEGQLIIYPNKIIPLPEAEEYIKRKAIQKQENNVQQSSFHRISFDIPEYGDDELADKLRNFLSNQSNLTKRIIAFLKILVSDKENKTFNREEIKTLMYETYKIGNSADHTGRFLSNISQSITNRSNDFLRQIIKF